MARKSKKTEAKVEEQAQVQEAQEAQKPVRSMSETLQKYRGAYKASHSASGRASLNVGDLIAKLLEGQTPDRVVAIAERALGLKKGELWAKYEGLNPGQQRMNAGNRIRAAFKRGDLDEKALKAAIH